MKELICIIVLSIVFFVKIAIVLRQEKKALKFRESSDVDFDELEVKYKKWHMTAEWLLVLFLLLLTALYTSILYLTAIAIHSASETCEYLIILNLSVWCIHAIFLGIITSVLPITVILRFLLGKERYDEYVLYEKFREGPDRKKFLVFLAVIVIGICCVSLIFCFDCYVKVKNDGIAVNKFLGFGETEYSYDEIRELRFIKSKDGKKGRIKRKKYHEIEFSDGDILSFDKSVFNKNLEEQSEMLKIIGERSNREVIVVDPYLSSVR